MTKMAAKWLKSIPSLWPKRLKTIPFGAARTYIAHIRKYPPPGLDSQAMLASIDGCSPRDYACWYWHHSVRRSCFFVFDGWCKSESSLLLDSLYIDPTESSEKLCSNCPLRLSLQPKEFAIKIFTSWPLYIVTALFGIGCVSGIVIPIFDYYNN